MKYICLLSLFLLSIGLVSASAQVISGSESRKIVTIPLVIDQVNGEPLALLTGEEVAVTHNGRPQKIEYIRGAEDPMHLAVIIDARPYDEKVSLNLRRAAMRLIDRLGISDQATVMRFGKKVKLLSEWTAEKSKLRRAIDRAEAIVVPLIEETMVIPRDELDLYGPNDAVAVSLSKQFSKVQGRKAIILVTNGNGLGKTADKEIEAALAGTDVVVYTVFFPSPTLYHVLMMQGLNELAVKYRTKSTLTMEELIRMPPINYLNSLARATGGRLYAADKLDFDAAFEQVTRELNRQFIVGVNFEGKSSTNFSDFSIYIKRSEVSARTKQTVQLRIKHHTNSRQ